MFSVFCVLKPRVLCSDGVFCVLSSPSQIESALIEHPSVSEAAVVAVPHSIKGEAVYCFVTNKQGSDWSDQLRTDLVMKGGCRGCSGDCGVGKRPRMWRAY